MDLSAIGLLLLGLLLRVGIPVGITILLFRWLSKLDERWQEEARLEAYLASAGARVANRGCWDTKHCTPEQKAKCPAFARKEIPCWQVFRQPNGKLRQGCIGCTVFITAPIPASTG